MLARASNLLVITSFWPCRRDARPTQSLPQKAAALPQPFGAPLAASPSFPGLPPPRQSCIAFYHAPPRTHLLPATDPGSSDRCTPHPQTPPKDHARPTSSWPHPTRPPTTPKPDLGRRKPRKREARCRRPPTGKMHRASLASALLLCSLCPLFAQPSQAFLEAGTGAGAYISRLLGESYIDEKLPMAVVVPSVPDDSPLPAPAAVAVAAPAPTPTPVPGSEDYMPKLPSERMSPGAPASGNAGAPEPAASGDGASTAFISSNPAVPLPAGVTDSATVLPMPTPGQGQRQDVGMGTLLQARAVPLVVPLLVMVLHIWAFLLL